MSPDKRVSIRCVFLLTRYFRRQPLECATASRLLRNLGCLGNGGCCPNFVQDLKIAKALAGELALHVDSLPALEAIGWGPVAEEAALGVGRRRLKLGLDHVERGGMRRRDGGVGVFSVVDDLVVAEVG